MPNKIDDGGHWQKGRIGPLSNAWAGGVKNTGGYIYLYMPRHPNSIGTGYIAEHLFLAIKALGKPLPLKCIVHHHDENKGNNNPRNLVVCENDSYHKLLHSRMRAKKYSGNPSWRKCRHCNQWDSQNNLYISEKWKYANHRKCHAEYVRNSQKSY